MAAVAPPLPQQQQQQQQHQLIADGQPSAAADAATPAPAGSVDVEMADAAPAPSAGAPQQQQHHHQHHPQPPQASTGPLMELVVRDNGAIDLGPSATGAAAATAAAAGLPRLLRVPPRYDDLARCGAAPRLEDVYIDESLLRGGGLSAPMLNRMLDAARRRGAARAAHRAAPKALLHVKRQPCPSDLAGAGAGDAAAHSESDQAQQQQKRRRQRWVVELEPAEYLPSALAPPLPEQRAAHDALVAALPSAAEAATAALGAQQQQQQPPRRPRPLFGPVSAETAAAQAEAEAAAAAAAAASDLAAAAAAREAQREAKEAQREAIAAAREAQREAAAAAREAAAAAREAREFERYAARETKEALREAKRQRALLEASPSAAALLPAEEDFGSAFKRPVTSSWDVVRCLFFVVLLDGEGGRVSTALLRLLPLHAAAAPSPLNLTTYSSSQSKYTINN